MKKHYYLIILITIFFIFAFPACQKRIVYADKTALLTKTTIALNARNEVEAKILEYQLEIQDKEKEIDTLQSLLEKSKDTETINKELEEKISVYEEYIKTANEEIKKLEEEVMKPVYKEINEKLKAFGEKYGYDMILGATTAGNILYVSERVDVTEKVIEFINKSNKTE